MQINNFEKVKTLYDNGFRCIRYENGDNGEFTAYFKNFEKEEIDSLVCEDENEISEIKSFIDTY